MGSWGYGMQANDTALDGIFLAEEFLKENPNGDLAELVANGFPAWGFESSLDDHHRPLPWYAEAVLGIADWCLDHRRTISLAFRQPIYDCMIAEVRQSRMNAYREPERRIEALRRFHMRFNGIGVSDEDLARDNESLLSCARRWVKEDRKGLLNVNRPPTE